MAGNRIKGLTIEIGADTVELSDALKKVDTSLKETQTRLRDVNKLLKMDPKNTDLLKQKQELLAKRVKDTDDRLKELKKTQEQMDAKGVDKNSDAYKDLEREIIATEQQLEKAKAASQQFGTVFGQQLQAVGAELQKVGGKITEVGESLTKNVTGPVVAAGTASLAAWNKVDDGMDIIIKKTGATGDQLEEMKDMAKDIGSSMPVSFDKIGSAIGEVSTRFGVTGDKLQGLSEQFLMFSEINDVDVSTSVDNVQKAMAAYGVSVDDTGHFLDLLTTVSQNTGVSVDKLENGLIQNAAAFQEMGLSCDQAVAFMGELETSGANSETVMNGLRKALKNSAKDGKDMNTALAELQDGILNGTDSMDGLTLAYELFGKSGDQIYAAIKNGTLDFNDLADASLETGDAVANTFNEMMDPADQWQTVLNTLMTLGYEIAEAVMPAIQAVVETLIPVIQGLIDGWNSLDEDTQAFILTAVAVVAAIGPIITIVGTVISTLGTVISVIGSVMGVIGTVIGVLGGPLTAAIAAVIAIVVVCWQHWDTLKQKGIELWQSLSEKWASIKQSVVDAVTGAWQTARDKFESIRSTIEEKINAAKDTVHDVIETIKGFFNFSWSLPSLKLPHISASGSFSLSPLSVPHFSLEWYKKAMEDGMILNAPTIFGMKGNKLLAGGEAGPEVVVGADSLYSMIKRATEGRSVSAPVNVSVVVNGNVDDSDRFGRQIGNTLANIISRNNEVFS